MIIATNFHPRLSTQHCLSLVSRQCGKPNSKFSRYRDESYQDVRKELVVQLEERQTDVECDEAMPMTEACTSLWTQMILPNL